MTEQRIYVKSISEFILNFEIIYIRQCPIYTCSACLACPLHAVDAGIS